MKTTEDEVLRRMHRFERALQENAAQRIVRLDWGAAYFNDRFPKVYDLNLIRVEEAAKDLRATDLIAAADRLQGGARLSHRKVYVEDERLGESVRAGFEDAGWETTRFLFMVHDRQPQQDIATSHVKEVDWPTFRPLRLEMMRREKWATTEDEARQVCDSALAVRSAVHVRFFIVYADDTPTSCCFLYSNGDTAQIEDVATLEEHRRRGLARAVVWSALQESRAAGHDLTFLVADDEDTPKELYRKLGFADAGRAYSFTRLPTGQPGQRAG